MMIRFLLLVSLCLSAQFTLAQSGSTRSFMLGPSIGIDQVSYVTPAGYVGTPSAATPTRLTVGIDASYQANRLLVGAKLLYTRRTSQETPAANPNPGNQVDRTDTDMKVLTVPVTVSYRIAGKFRFQWYVGGSIGVYCLLPGGAIRRYSGGTLVGQSAYSEEAHGRSVNVGYGAQTTLRYLITPAIVLQLEPAVHYYSSGSFPSIGYRTHQVQGTFSVLFKV